jgi:hypothetical protein
VNFYLKETIINEKAEIICLRLSTQFMLQTAGIINSRVIVYSGALRSVCYISDSSSKEVHVRWVPCHHGMSRPEVVDGGDSLQIWRVAANILNKQSRTASKG